MSLNMSSQPAATEEKDIDKPALTASDFAPIPAEAEFKFVAPINKNKIKRVEIAVFKSPGDPPDGFDSCEHFEAGNNAFEAFMKEIGQDDSDIADLIYAPDADKELKISDKITLQPGQIVALAGDFYGIPERPICFGKTPEERAQNFEAAYDTLATANTDEMGKIIGRIKADYDAVQVCLSKGLQQTPPSKVLDARAASNNIAYTLITSKLLFPALLTFPIESRYEKLAAENYDHFQDEARSAYETGHKVALKKAQDAFKEEDPDKKVALFVEALTRELFACHFLTDLFSAGHLRVPRKALYDYVANHGLFFKSEVAGVLAMKMHGQDNHTGLYVKSAKHPEPWLAKGDECYFEHDQGTNRNQMQAALIAALKDIYVAYKQDKVEAVPSAFAYLPVVAVEDARNNQPLFKINPKNAEDVQVRKDLDNPRSDVYQSGWSPTLLAAKLYLKKDKEIHEAKESLDKPAVEGEARNTPSFCVIS